MTMRLLSSSLSSKILNTYLSHSCFSSSRLQIFSSLKAVLHSELSLSKITSPFHAVLINAAAVK